MTSKTPGWQITPRDLELLAALDYAPLTARQLQKLSETWATPFGSVRLVRERLQRLAAAKLVTSHPYSIMQPGQPELYAVLTRRGFQLVHGPDVEPTTKGCFSPVALARQPHQRALSDFIVHTAWGAWQSEIRLLSFYRENTIRLDAGGQSVYPDSSFVLSRGNESFRFYVEIDNGSERVQSQRDADSIERKIRTYEAYQDLVPTSRFRVVFVSARDSAPRLQHILGLAGRIARDSNRTLFYGITQTRFLTSPYAVTSPIFWDPRGRTQSLIPDIPVATLLQSQVLLTAKSA